MGVNIEKIMAAKQVSISSLLYVSVLIGFFVILTSLLLGRMLTSPIIQLARGAESIAGGNYDVRMKLDSKDEIGELANVFNKMSDSLKIQRDEILELQQFFEKIVEQSPSAIVIGNESAEVITMNPAAERLLERPLAQLKDKQFFDMLPAFKPLQEDYFKVMLSGTPCFYDNYSVVHDRGRRKDPAPDALQDPPARQPRPRSCRSRTSAKNSSSRKSCSTPRSSARSASCSAASPTNSTT